MVGLPAWNMERRRRLRSADTVHGMSDRHIVTNGKAATASLDTASLNKPVYHPFASLVTVISMAEETPLNQRSCEACASKGGAPEVLSEESCQRFKAQLCPSWDIVETDNGDALSRKFTAKNFQAGMDFLVEVGKLAEAEGHHPDLHLVDYRTVIITVQTHSLKTLSHNDFILAAKTDLIPAVYSPKFLKENPNITAGR